MGRSWWIGALAALSGCGGCEQPPPSQTFCEMLESCERAELLVGAEECSAQVQVALGRETTDCRSCVMTMPCRGAQDVLAGRKPLPRLCPACSREVVDPTHPPEAAPAAPYFIIPALVAGLVELPEDEAERDELVRTQASDLCDMGDECEESVLLLTTEECSEQIYAVLKQQDDTCRRCAASLSCPGIDKVVSGQVALDVLCNTCRIDATGGCAEGEETCATSSTGPYLLIPGFVKAPPPPPEEGEEQEGEAESAAEGAPQAQAPVAPAAPVTPVAETAAAPAAKPAAVPPAE